MQHFPDIYHYLNATRKPIVRLLFGAIAVFSITMAASAIAADGHGGEVKGAPTKKADIEVSTSSDAKATGNAVRDALGVTILPNKKLTIMVKGKPESPMANASASANAPEHKTIVVTPSAAPTKSRQSAQARKAALAAALRAAVHGNDVHWSYAGDSGPLAWGNLKPEFNLCALGKRQSPINIEDGSTLQGPAEPVVFDYTPSNGTVVNNGHTIQVDVQGENSILVRSTSYRLLQFHFHNPSEEQVNFRRSAMVAHLVHKSAEGQLAVVAVLLEPGAANQLIDKVWTYMPLDAGDKVRMPQNLLNLNELLPADQRYYQFMGSLTTPPCSEGVLWMVMKQPTTISRAQIKLFSQLYPNNARPVQPVNARPVRDAQ
jgi:carbonic anhydrase